VCVLGAGSFGTAIAHVLGVGAMGGAQEGGGAVQCIQCVTLWARRERVAQEINSHGTNRQYVPENVRAAPLFGARRERVAQETNAHGTNRQYVPEGVRAAPLFGGGVSAVSATSVLAEALRGCTVIVIAVPSAFLGALLARVRACGERRVFDLSGAAVVNLVKSLHYAEEEATLTTVSDDIERALPGVPVTSLMGPNIFREMVQPGEFAEATVGFRPRDAAAAARVQRLFSSTPNFHVSLCDDRTGVELCGGLKNVVSLAAGFCEGLGLGGNAKAAAIRAGLLEMARLPAALGIASANEDTVLREACGVGDLILTCTVGRGRRLAAAFVEEGVKVGPCASVEASMRRWAELESGLWRGMKLPDWHNARAVHKALVANGLGADRFPLFHAVYRISYAGTDPREILDAIKASGVAAAAAPATAAVAAPVLPDDVATTSHVSPRTMGVRSGAGGSSGAGAGTRVTMLSASATTGNVDLTGKRALVTGAGNGIGKAIAGYLVSCGARVTALDLDGDALCAVQREIGCDVLVANLLDCEAAVASVKARMAEKGAFDLLVNCAGVARFEKIMETTKAAFDFQIGVNYRAVALLSDAVAHALVAANKPGSFVHISSQSSTLPLADHLVYSSSKAAVDHMARIQAFELGPLGIRVNTVRPTVVLTELVRKSWDPAGLDKMKQNIPLRRFAEPLDVAKAVGWLLSDNARLVTGVALPVDGGRSMGGFGL
jgi:glycerol-3-phosphate dehydrogenase/NAD(P)-dependent dehydrogenase (short-subunit alcohol dehydrogenase family)